MTTGSPETATAKELKKQLRRLKHVGNGSSSEAAALEERLKARETWEKDVAQVKGSITEKSKLLPNADVSKEIAELQKQLEEERNHEEGSSAHEDSTKTINELEDRIRNLQKLVINNNSTQYSAPKVTRRQTVCLSSLRQNQFARPFPIQRQKTTTSEEDDLFPEEENALDRIDQDRELNLLQQIGKSKARYWHLDSVR